MWMGIEQPPSPNIVHDCIKEDLRKYMMCNIKLL